MAGDKIVLNNILVEQNKIESTFLKRIVQADAYLPTNVPHPENLSLLLINDGQDLPKMPFEEILNTLIAENIIEPLVCVGIHCGPDRKMEYGTAKKKDYKGRGAKARQYTRFVFEELLPFIHNIYSVQSFKEKSFAGFSLGGLSALDIVWNHPKEFTKVGVFSGSLWWRSKSYKEGYNDSTDRIMQRQIKKGKYYSWLKFFFECGALDETKDRNNNGIIDSIDDTLDLIKELKQKGYPDAHIEYLEIADGKHDVPTWGRAFPYFLQWGWGK
jgi:enterochelin esterase-like enzyme